MQSWELFEHQDEAYRDCVLYPDVAARVSVEMGSVIGWDRYVAQPEPGSGCIPSALLPLKDLLEKFGFTPEAVLRAAKSRLPSQADDVMTAQSRSQASLFLVSPDAEGHLAAGRYLSPMSPRLWRMVG